MSKHKNKGIVRQVQFAHFSGPLPHPDALVKYDEVLPGTADRIIRMAEEQQKHRQSLELLVVSANAHSQKVGPWLGFIVAMTAVIGGIWLLALGRRIEGFSSIFVPLAGLVAVFFYGKHQQTKDREQKADAFVRAAQRFGQ